MVWIHFGVLSVLVAAVAVFVTMARLRPSEVQSRPTHPVLLSLVAGALWPLLLVGLAEFAIVAAMPAALRPRRRRGQSVSAVAAAATTALAQR
jgi:hypothetical protein